MAIKSFRYAFIVLLAMFSVGVYGIFNDASVSAAEQAPIHLQVSPTKQRLSLDPGSVYRSSFTVQNVGSMQFSYSTEAVPYSVTDSNYSPDYSTVATYSQIAEWVTFDSEKQTGTLQPGESIEVPFTIKVPEDVASGAQYAAIMARTGDGNSETANIQTINRVGMILYANIAGDTREEGEIVDNKVPGFLFDPPITVTGLVKNTGNVETSAKYTVKIWPLFSNETIYNNEENPGNLDVMPETSRFSTITWEGAPKLGIFTVEQKIEFAGKENTVKKLVVICPVWLLFIIIALIFFMIFWLISRARNRGRENSR